jgi:hypothetical protein
MMLAAALVGGALTEGATALVRGGAKPPKCRANVCAYWSASGVLQPPSHNVVSVTHSSTGTYCVELSPKIDAHLARPVFSVDYVHTLGFVNIAMWDGFCGTNGVQVYTYNDDSTATTQDAAVVMTVP